MLPECHPATRGQEKNVVPLRGIAEKQLRCHDKKVLVGGGHLARPSLWAQSLPRKAQSRGAGGQLA
jgi:hypothetical protein